MHGEISSQVMYCPSLRSGQYCHPRTEYFPILPTLPCNIYLRRKVQSLSPGNFPAFLSRGNFPAFVIKCRKFPGISKCRKFSVTAFLLESRKFSGIYVVCSYTPQRSLFTCALLLSSTLTISASLSYSLASSNLIAN